MQIVVVANDGLKKELLNQGIASAAMIEWVEDVDAIKNSGADACIDLLFSSDRPSRMKKLIQLSFPLVLVNDVAQSSAALPVSLVRFNGWNTLLRREIMEAAHTDENYKRAAEKVISCFSKKIEWTDDLPGFISARVISMIINEAYFALSEEVSTREQIDTAMKTGTNYPYGPFEWCELIGKHDVVQLLTAMSAESKIYEPCPLLLTEART